MHCEVAYESLGQNDRNYKLINPILNIDKLLQNWYLKPQLFFHQLNKIVNKYKVIAKCD